MFVVVVVDVDDAKTISEWMKVGREVLQSWQSRNCQGCRKLGCEEVAWEVEKSQSVHL
jgi:hypothetical protein